MVPELRPRGIGEMLDVAVAIYRASARRLVLVALCGGNCRSGMTGTATFSSDIVDKIERGQTYVNVHTAKNPAGEIRGQVKVTDG